MAEQTPIPEERPKFWKRQFSEAPTRAQMIFDVIVGTIIPIVLLILDPVVFRGGGTLGAYGFFAYLAIGLEAVSLVVWLAAGSRLADRAGFFAGCLLVGGLFAAGVGIAMLPLSILGLFFVCLGLLGFIPFLTAFVYFRNGVRAFRLTRSSPSGKTWVAAMMLSGVLGALGLPALAQVWVSGEIDRSINTIVANRSETDTAMAVDDLKKINSLCLGLCSANIDTAFRNAGSGETELQRHLNEVAREILPQYSDYSPLSLLAGGGSSSGE